MENELENGLKFFKAAKEGLSRGQVKTFECPLCKGTAIASKSNKNGHIHAKCNKCKMSIIQ